MGHFIRKYGCLGPFEMEAVEQLNYVNKLVFFKASNHGKGNSPHTITEQVQCDNIVLCYVDNFVDHYKNVIQWHIY